MARAGHWEVAMDYAQMGNFDGEHEEGLLTLGEKQQAIVDSGTSYVLLPKGELDQIVADLKK